jgi:hypothetical protein
VGVLIYEPPAIDSIERLEDELARAFVSIRRAVADGDAVVVSLDERDLQGTGTVAGAALAGGLLGMVRALAIEGAKPGWNIAALSSTTDVEPAERQRWIEQLADGGSVRGALVRLGGQHLGKVPV